MARTVGQPKNKNQLSQLGFQFSVRKLPATNFFATRVNLPGLTGNVPRVSTPFSPLPVGYDKIEYGDLSVTFKVDEDLVNYMELFDWMVGIGFPTKFEERKMLERSNASTERVYSDGSVIVQTSAKNPNIQFMYKDLIPYQLTDLEFSTQDTDVNYIEATVSFRYSYYTVERLRKS